MIWFDRLYPPLLMLTALAFTVSVKRRPGHQLDHDKVLLVRLAVATFIFITLFAVVQLVLEQTIAQRNILRALWPTLAAMSGCVVLWIRFAGPALAAREPGYRPIPEANDTAVRSASLVPRHNKDDISPLAWSVGWSIFGLSTVITMWAIAEGSSSIMLLGLGWWLGMAYQGAYATRMEPEPLDADGSPKLRATYAAYRAQRSWMCFALGLSGTVAYAFLATIFVIAPQSTGMLGALMGSTIGIGGAVFGLLCAIRRARAQALLHELGEAGRENATE